MKTKAVLGIFLLLAFSGTCLGGWMDTTLEGVGKKLGNKAVKDAGKSANDPAKGTTRDSMKEKPADDKGSPQQKSATSESAATIEEAEAVYSKFDFIPGDKTIFSDDFSDTDVGEFPRKWHLNGPKGGNNAAVEVVEYQGKRFLRTNPSQKGQTQFESTQYIRLNQAGDLPEKFTVEFDALFSNAIASNAKFPNRYFLFLLGEKAGWPGTGSGHGKQAGKLLLSGKENYSLNTSTNLDIQDEGVHRVSVSVNGTFVKAYIDSTRVINDPDGVKRPIRHVGLSLANISSKQTDKLMITNFRLAAGGKDVKSALDTDGKIVTHGILFDTGKDSIKPESLPTLKMILALLTDDPGLKFSIEGHTDSQGSKDINQPLSERRAGAVSNWLAGKGIDQSRLTIKGFGDTVPIDDNKSPEGRANNRRVEFVKF